MLNLRNAIVSVGLIAALVFAIVFVSVSSRALSDPADELVLLAASDERYPERSHRPPAENYRSLQEDCFDVPLRELAGCRAESQAAPTPYRSPEDVCYDVPLRELANCRKASQAPLP